MIDALAWALIHFLWQGALLGACALVLLRVAPAPQARYAIGVATLAAMVLSVGASTAWLMARGVTPQVVSRTIDAGSQIEETVRVADRPAGSGAAGTVPSTGLAVPTTWVVGLWGLGVLLLSVRLLGGWSVARRLTRVHVSPVSPAISETMEELAKRLGLTRLVRVLSSTSVSSPMVVGWLAPVVLLPAAASTGLPASHVAALLAHELAHVRRHDYLVNLFQSVVETLLFFHPAVWWLSRRVRDAREECCDDLALLVADRMTYASALASVARHANADLVLAATGGTLSARIRRIVLGSSSPDVSGGGWLTLLPVLLLAALVGSTAGAERNDAPPQRASISQSADPEGVAPAIDEKPRPGGATPGAPSAQARQFETLILEPQAALNEAADRARLARAAYDAIKDVPLDDPRIDLFPAMNTDAVVAARKADVARLADELRRMPHGDAHPARLAKTAELRMAEEQLRLARAAVVSWLRIDMVRADSAERVRRRNLGAVETLMKGASLQLSTEVTQANLRQAIDAQEAIARDLASARDELQRQLLAHGPEKGQSIVETVRLIDGQLVDVRARIASARRDLAALETDIAEEIFVLGEVRVQGRHTWTSGMTVKQAIESAGGMTPGAKPGHILRSEHQGDGSRVYRKLASISMEAELRPGDELVIIKGGSTGGL